MDFISNRDKCSVLSVHPLSPSAWFFSRNQTHNEMCLFLFLNFIFPHFTTNLNRHAMMVAIITSNICSFNLSIFSCFDFYLFSMLCVTCILMVLFLILSLFLCFSFCSFVVERIIFVQSTFGGVRVSLLTFNLNKQKETNKSNAKHVYVANISIISTLT